MFAVPECKFQGPRAIKISGPRVRDHLRRKSRPAYKVARVHMTNYDSEGSGVENERFFAERKLAVNNHRKMWSNEAADMLINMWLEETIQFALENCKTQRKRERYTTRYR